MSPDPAFFYKTLGLPPHFDFLKGFGTSASVILRDTHISQLLRKGLWGDGKTIR